MSTVTIAGRVRVRPYRKGDRVRHVGLGDGLFVSHATVNGKHATYRITFKHGDVMLLAGFCAGKLRRLPKARR